MVREPSGLGPSSDFQNEVMSKAEARAMLLRIHYRLMDSPRFWYERWMLDASRILCVAASDLRQEMEGALYNTRTT